MRSRTISIAAIALLSLTACVSSRQARRVTPGGFLGTSAQLLEKGRRGEEALLVYHNPSARWATYDNVMLDPIAIWDANPVNVTADQAADFQKLVDSFDVTLRAKLAKSYTIVTAPETKTLQIQIAIVNGGQANSTLKVAKLVAPYASIADVLWTFGTGKPAFAGEVSLEYMVKDAQTGELLAAGADRRVGGNQLGASTFTRWGDVRNILTYWSDLTVYRLCLDRATAVCQRPSAGLTDQ
jgi:hypothetical protein